MNTLETKDFLPFSGGIEITLWAKMASSIKLTFIEDESGIFSSKETNITQIYEFKTCMPEELIH